MSRIYRGVQVKYFKLVGCLILMMFLTGCTSSEWYELLCSGTSDSWFFDATMWMICPDVNPTYVKDSECSEGFINTKTKNCVTCGKDSKFDVSVEKCVCKNSADSMNPQGDCVPKATPEKPATTTQTKPVTTTTPESETIEEQRQCTFSEGSPGVGCSEAYVDYVKCGTCVGKILKRCDCINYKCVMQDFACPNRCEGGACK